MRRRAELEALGYTVQVARGDVTVEEQALADAVALAAADRIEADVQAIADKAAIDARAVAVQRGIAAANIPGAVAEAVARITAAALETITAARQDTVAFHTRAVEIARSMPTTYVVSGHGIESLYVNVDDDSGDGADADDRAVIASVLEPGAHKWRRFFKIIVDRRPDRADEILGALRIIRDGKGYDLDPGVQDDGTGLQIRVLNPADGTVAATITTLAQLAAAARDLPDLNG